MSRIIVRGYAKGQLLFEQAGEDSAEAVQAVFKQFAQALIDNPLHAIEVENLDEPNVNDRFFRFGTDPDAGAAHGRGLVMPLEVDLEKLR